jgi:hypothetical protein
MRRRKGKCMLHEEIILHLYDSIIVSLFIRDHYIQDFWMYFPVSLCIISLKLIQFGILYHPHTFWDICPDRLVSPEISFGFDFLLRERIIDDIGEGIIEIKRIHRSWEELSQCSIGLHRGKYLTYFLFPFFFGVLFIEYAIGFILESDTAEAVVTIFYKITVIKVTRFSNL